MWDGLVGADVWANKRCNLLLAARHWWCTTPKFFEFKAKCQMEIHSNNPPAPSPASSLSLCWVWFMKCHTEGAPGATARETTDNPLISESHPGLRRWRWRREEVERGFPAGTVSTTLKAHKDCYLLWQSTCQLLDIDRWPGWEFHPRLNKPKRWEGLRSVLGFSVFDENPLRNFFFQRKFKSRVLKSSYKIFLISFWHHPTKNVTN